MVEFRCALMGHREGRPGAKNGISKVMEVGNLREQGAVSAQAECPEFRGVGTGLGRVEGPPECPQCTRPRSVIAAAAPG